MSIPASGPKRASALVQALWRELAKPADELDLAAIVERCDLAAAALALVGDRFQAAFVAKSRRKSKALFEAPLGELEASTNRVRAALGVGPMQRPRARSWHELPLVVATVAVPGVGTDWPERLAALVGQFPRALQKIDAEFRAATRKPRGSVAAALAYLVKNPNATDVEAAEAAGVTTRALRASKRWRLVRERQREQSEREAQERFENAEASVRSSGLRIRKNRPK